MDKLIVTLTGIGMIAGIYWYFFGRKDEAVDTKDAWHILVEGGYKPSTISVPHGKTATITFTRKDPSSCLEEIVIPEFKIKTFLPVNTPVTVTLPPAEPGTYAMHCGMNMFHGKVVVV